MQPVKGETKRDCWAVAFGNSFNDAERIVVAGYDNGDLKMFDLRTMSLRWECNLKNGVCDIFYFFCSFTTCYKTKSFCCLCLSECINVTKRNCFVFVYYSLNLADRVTIFVIQ